MTAQSPSIGFVLVSHGDPAQLLRVIEGLNCHFDDPPIAVHHDSHQTPIDQSVFPANVRFTTRVFRTAWAKWPIVASALEALEILYEHNDPDWFFVLSAADYPVAPAAEVRKHLAKTKADAFQDIHSPLPEYETQATLIGTPNPALQFFSSPLNKEQKYRFYMSRQVWIPILRFSPRLRIGRKTWWPSWLPDNPYSDKLPLLYGDFWFGARRKVAHYLLADTPLKQRLSQHYRRRPMPEETFFQVMVTSNPDFTVDRDSRRWAEWLGGGAHPQWMTRDYTDRALSSNAFFARKFEAGSELLDYIDEQIG